MKMLKYFCSAKNTILLSASSRSLVRHFGQPAAQTHPHLIQNGEVTPGITKEEFRQRRRNLIHKISTTSYHKSQHSHIVIIPSATKTYMTHDIPYIFRQNTDFLYLCGFQEPDSVLILECNSTDPSSHTATLFVPKKHPYKELWEGPRSGIDGTLELTGIDNAENTESLAIYLNSYLKENKTSVIWYNYKKPTHLEFHMKCMTNFLKGNSNGFIDNPTSIIQSMRLIKSPAEIEIMAGSNRIASEAFTDVMRFSKPGINEAHLFAKMDFECRIRGAEYLAYPPVVAGGNRANTIHYINNNQVIAGGEMVLMDAGCEYHGYTSDITRTWPVSGEFSNIQRGLYEAVLDIQTECIKRCADREISINTIFEEMCSLVALRLKELGVIKRTATMEEARSLARSFCPHHLGHYLGMDVHDTDEVSRCVNLQPGMVITVEPGIYIPNSNLDVHWEFRGQGIRIEDNILITESGYRNLTEHCPKDPTVLEQIVNSGQTNNTGF